MMNAWHVQHQGAFVMGWQMTDRRPPVRKKTSAQILRRRDSPGGGGARHR
jgi:hypothetical protein